MGKKKTALDKAMAYYKKVVEPNKQPAGSENVEYKKFYEDDGDRYVMVGTDGSWEFASDTGVEKMWRGIVKDIYESIAKALKENNNE